MISIEQIRKLENKTIEVLELLDKYKRENIRLHETLQSCETRISELESDLHSFMNDQNEIEEGIKKALENLENVDASDFTETETDSGTHPELNESPNNEENEQDSFTYDNKDDNKEESIALDTSTDPDEDEEGDIEIDLSLGTSSEDDEPSETESRFATENSDNEDDEENNSSDEELDLY